MPPANCCKDEFILIYAPLSYASGTSEFKAVAGTILLMIPINKTILTIITNQIGTGDK